MPDFSANFYSERYQTVNQAKSSFLSICLHNFLMALCLSCKNEVTFCVVSLCNSVFEKYIFSSEREYKHVWRMSEIFKFLWFRRHGDVYSDHTAFSGWRKERVLFFFLWINFHPTFFISDQILIVNLLYSWSEIKWLNQLFFLFDTMLLFLHEDVW